YCYYWYNEAGQVEYYCDYYYVFVGYAYVQDYSGFDQDGLAIASAFHIGGNGQMSPDLTPGSADGKAVDAAFRRVFNIPTLRGVLDTGCGGPVLSYDGETQPPCSADNIGQFILIRFATYTERGSCRYLTLGEKNGASGEGLQIIGVNKVRVCHKGFTIFGNGQVMSPN